MIQIRVLEPSDITSLNQFLITGFGAAVDAEFASPDVLRWKYCDHENVANCPKGFVASDGGRIAGFAGVDPVWFVFEDLHKQVTAGHCIDWLASKANVAVGLLVLDRADACTDVQFVIGGTPVAVAIRRKLGWQFPVEVGMYGRVLRPMHRLRKGRLDPLWKAALKVGRDYARRFHNPRRVPSVQLHLRQVTVFGKEIEQVTQTCRLREIHTIRSAERLNHYLRYPKSKVTGWLLEEGGRTRGFALLNVSLRDGVFVGRIVDCFMDNPDPHLWHSALHALTGQLNAQRADISLCYGSTEWMNRALLLNGYYLERFSPLAVRDTKHLLPRDASFYLTLLEADHGYL